MAHNPARPFIVAVGRLDVRAVGTAFNIRSASDRVVVTVTKGTIEVYPSTVWQQPTNGAAPSDAIRVTTGSEVTWTPRCPTVTLVDPTRALAWLQEGCGLSAGPVDVGFERGRNSSFRALCRLASPSPTKVCKVFIRDSLSLDLTSDSSLKSYFQAFLVARSSFHVPCNSKKKSPGNGQGFSQL